MELTSGITGYGGAGRTISIPSSVRAAAASEAPATAPNEPAPAAPSYPTTPAGLPDFAKMTPAQRLAYHKARLDGMFR